MRKWSPGSSRTLPTSAGNQVSRILVAWIDEFLRLLDIAKLDPIVAVAEPEIHGETE